MKRYKVTAPCVVHIPTVNASGPSLGTFYQHAILPDGVPADKLKHLLDSSMIVEIGEDGAPVEQAAEKPAGDGDPGGGKAEAGKITARSSKGDLVAYAVTQGLAKEEAEALTVKDLVARFVKTEQPPPAGQPPAE